jgi:hypothetical protein
LNNLDAGILVHAVDTAMIKQQSKQRLVFNYDQLKGLTASIQHGPFE